MPFLLRALFLLALAVSAQAQTQPSVQPFAASAPLNLMLKNAQWFDGAGFKRGTLYVVDGKFTATKPKQVHRSMDLKNQFLVPPLADAHNYNLQNDWGADHFANRYVADGVYYAAMLCADPAGVDPIRSRFSLPQTPDVLFATACVTSGEGQPLPALLAASPGKTRADFADKAVIVMDKAEDVERKWPLLMTRKTDMLRLVLGYSGKQGLNAETALALTQRAKKAGLRVIAHVETAADFDLALRAGVDVIDHVPGYSQPIGEPPERFQLSAESAVQAARQKISVITGMAAAQLFKMKPAQTEMHKRNLLILKEAGVNLLMGSDLFTETALAELRALAATGQFSNEELLRMATIATPRALFPKRQLGCFDPGCEASFLLLADDPTKNLDAMGQPLLRVKQGRLLTQDEQVAKTANDSSQTTDAPAKKKSKKAATKKKTATKSAARSSTKSASKPE
ncbi:MAG: amidohydrolase family protein [Paucibacter sp.]|nr:amidohydrolase family protein [Roseateles sp.]